MSIPDLSKYPLTSPQQLAQLGLEFGELELSRFSDEHQKHLLESFSKLEIGGMYYWGNLRYNATFDVYILDNILRRISNTNSRRSKKGEIEFICLVRVWDWERKVWAAIPNNLPEYAHEVSLTEFLENIHLPKLTKNPLELYEEAKAAMDSGDISQYTLAADEVEGDNGPDTQLMHLGSKEALENIHSALESRRNHAELIRMNMEMIIEQKKQELESIKDKLQGAIVQFEKKIKKIFRVITTLELYLGVDEQIIQILEGPAAPASDPICIRQGLMFMDEEFGDPWDDGQGIEWHDLSAFGDWLVRNTNYKRVLPESKCIAAFKVRRNPKERSGNPYWVAKMKEMDNYTFLVMRNGDNIYRLITDKIEFLPRLFPKRKELQQLFELWREADRAEEKERMSDQKEFEKENQEFTEPEYREAEKKKLDQQDYSETYFRIDAHDNNGASKRYPDLSLGNFYRTGEVKEYSENHVFFYKMRFTLFQGIIERTQIFHPLSETIKLFDHSAVNKGLVKLIYDDELTLPTGKPGFWEWMKKLNDQIDYGSRIVLSHNWGFISQFIQNRGDYSAYHAHQELGNRLDDRFGDGTRFSRLPKDPNPGLYYVKKGERWESVPVWIDNPSWKPELYSTPDEREYCPLDSSDLYPKEIKPYYSEKEYNNNREHLTAIYMDYDEQKRLFGKVIGKAPFPGYTAWRVYVLKNPKRIHRHICDHSDNRRSPLYDWEDQKMNFLCVRYNPKDKIERQGWTWKWDAEERKNNLSWKITPDDAFILNYDLVTTEDIDFYLNSRIDRRHYLHMMPLLWEVRQQLEHEQAEEKDFKELVKAEVHKISGVIPSDEMVHHACEDWKKNLKWKRAITHDDQKALRMIVKSISKQV